MSGCYVDYTGDTINTMYYDSACEVIYPYTYVELTDTLICPKIKLDIYKKKIVKVRWENNEKL